MLCICNAKGILGSRIHKTDKFVSSEISTSTIHFHFCVWRVCLAAQKNHAVDWEKKRHRFFFSAYENFGSKTHTTRNTRTHARAFAIRNGGLKKKTNASAFACRDWIRCHFVTSFVCMCESHGGLCTYAAFPKLLHIFFIIFHQSARHHFFFCCCLLPCPRVVPTANSICDVCDVCIRAVRLYVCTFMPTAQLQWLLFDDCDGIHFRKHIFISNFLCSYAKTQRNRVSAIYHFCSRNCLLTGCGKENGNGEKSNHKRTQICTTERI